MFVDDAVRGVVFDDVVFVDDDDVTAELLTFGVKGGNESIRKSKFQKRGDMKEEEFNSSNH